jgi:hypothetical protein
MSCALLTLRSRIRTSSTLRPLNTSHRSLPPYIQATTYLKQTKSYGSTLHPCTRTPTKASKAAAKTGEYQPCPRQLPTHHRTRRCPMNPCIGATLDHTTKQAAIAAVVARRLLQTSAVTAQNLRTTSTHRCRLVTQHRGLPTMTWSFPNGRCTELLSRSYAKRNYKNRPFHGW